MTEVTSAVARDQLVTDMKAVIADAETLLKATAGETGERIASARIRAEESLKAAKARLTRLDAAVREHAKDAATAADDLVHENPWAAVGVAAVTGLVIGVLISRR